MRAGQAVVLGLIAYFWGSSLWANWNDLAGYRWQFRAGFLGASLALLLVHIFLLAQIWRWTLGYLGLRLPWQETTRIWALSQIARYLPGGVWDVAGRLVMTTRAGFSRPVVSASILLEMVLQTVSAVIIFVVSLLFWEDPTVARFALWTIPLVPVGLIALHPRILNAILRLAARLMKAEFDSLQLRYGDVFVLLSMHLGARVLIGTCFYLFALSAYSWGLSAWPIAIGIFAAAWVVGFLVVFVPMGLGVREGVMTLLLGAYLPVAPASVITIGFRIWIALRDVAFAGTGWLLQRSPSRPARGEANVHGK